LLAKLLFAVVLADGSTVGANGEGAQKNSFTGADSRSLWDFWTMHSHWPEGSWKSQPWPSSKCGVAWGNAASTSVVNE